MAENQPNTADQVVVDRGGATLSDLWLKEDYWAIWLGILILILGLIIFLPQKPEGMQAKIDQAKSAAAAEPKKAVSDSSEKEEKTKE